MKEPTTFVTVMFEPELPLLELQARSAGRFLEGSSVEQFLIIDNTKQGMSVPQRRRISHEYGALLPKVRFLRPTDLIDVPSADGWFIQQILKLAVARRVDSRTYVVLDAKDHFVRSTSGRDFVGDSGKGKVPVYPYTRHPLREHLERALTYLGADPEPYVSRFAATVTPFTFETEAVIAMMDELAARREPADFPGEFIEHGLLEFFVYSGWLMLQRGSLEAAFDVQDRSCPKVWKGSADRAGVRSALDQAAREDPALLSVHRRALMRVPLGAVNELAEFWRDRGLFATKLSALAFVVRFRAHYLLYELVRRASRSLGSRKS